MIVSSKFELDQLQFDGSGARGLHNESHCLVKKMRLSTNSRVFR